jgi:hypothetical protein
MADYIKLNPKFRESLNTGVVKRFLGKTCDKGKYNIDCKEKYKCDGGDDVEICPKKLLELIKIEIYEEAKQRPIPLPEPEKVTDMIRYIFQAKVNFMSKKTNNNCEKMVTTMKTKTKKATSTNQVAKKTAMKKPTAKKKVAKKTTTKKATTKK